MHKRSCLPGHEQPDTKKARGAHHRSPDSIFHYSKADTSFRHHFKLVCSFAISEMQLTVAIAILTCKYARKPHSRGTTSLEDFRSKSELTVQLLFSFVLRSACEKNIQPKGCIDFGTTEPSSRPVCPLSPYRSPDTITARSATIVIMRLDMQLHLTARVVESGRDVYFCLQSLRLTMDARLVERPAKSGAKACLPGT